MMLKKKTNRNKTRSLIIISVAAVILILFSVLIGICIANDRIPEFIRIIFGMSREENTETATAAIPDIVSDNGEEEQYAYFDLSAEEMFSLLHENESYCRRLRIISSYESERNVASYTITVKGNTFKSECASSTMIGSGDELYISSPAGEFITSVSTDVYSEVGIVSLEEVKNSIEGNNYKLSFGTDKRSIKVILYDENGIPTDEFEISTENGIVTTEYHYNNGVIYRAVVTDSISDYDGDDFVITKG
jgi:hypothetical protein